MKTISLLFSLLIVGITFGNSQSKATVLKAKNLQVKQEKGKWQVPGIQFFKFSKQELQKIQENASQTIRLEIPNSGKAPFLIDLNFDGSFDKNQVVKTSGNKIAKAGQSPALHYKGTVGGYKKSLAAFSFWEKGPMGIFSFGTGNFNFVKTDFIENDEPVFALFNDQNVTEKQNFTCLSDHLEDKIKIDNSLKTSDFDKGGSGIDACKKVSVYMECDHKMYLDNGSSVTNTVNWATSMLNVVSALYANEGIRLTASEVFVHTQPDNYPVTSSFAALAAFGDSLASRPPFIGDIAHLLSTKNNSLGGVAYLDVLCDGFGNNYAYSNIYNAFAPLPVYSWTVNVVAHEIGHNFGSPHTQSCSWPLGGGVFGMLDSCYASEEGCYNGPVIPIMGTIMSYCHLVLGVDLSKGFGLLPGALIRQKFIDATCLNGNVILPVLTISADDTVCAGSSKQFSVSDVTGAQYEWTGPNGYNAAVRQPVISPVNSSHNGLFSVIVKKDGCESFPLKTSLRVDCIPFLGDGDQTLCPLQLVPLQYFAQFLPVSGNVFTAEISNASGNFNNPTTIGTLSSLSKNGNFSIQIPGNLPSGNSYFIRIRSSQPTEIGEPIGPFSISPFGAEAQVNNAGRCGNGTVTFSGSGNFNYTWYSDSLTANPIATGSTFTTTPLTQTTAFWAESQQATKAQVGPINPQFSGSSGPLSNFTQGLYFKVLKDLTIDSVFVIAAGTGDVVFRIRDSANTKTLAQVQRPVVGNQTFEKIAIKLRLNPGTYRVDAVGSTVTSLVRSSNVNSFPFVAPGLLSITHATAESRYYWFFNWKISGLDCPGPRKKIWATINPIPSPPSIQSDSICRGGSLTLNANGALSGQTYQWFSPSGNLLPGATQSQYSTPVLNQTLVYSVAIRSQENCESSRTPVSAKVFPAPAPPLPDTVISCLGDTAILSAILPTGIANSFVWFQPNLNPISGQSASTISIPATVPDTIFYVSAISEKGCPSDTTTILLKANPRPSAPIVEVKPQCGPGPVTLIAHGILGASSFEWFTQANGGVPIPNATDSIFLTPPVLGSPVVYYVTPVNSFGCRLKIRSSALAFITPKPENATGSDSSRCGPGIFTLNASGAQPEEHYHWYFSENAAFSDTVSGGFSGSLNLPIQTVSADFYVSIVKQEFCESATRKLIRAIVLEQPQIPVLSLQDNFLVCSIDTAYDWYKNGVFLVTSGDSLNPNLYGNGLYQAILKKSNGCFAESNSILFTGVLKSKNQNQFSIFPNPARDRIKIKSRDGMIKRIELYDLHLRKLDERKMEAGEFELPVNHLPNGMYILFLENQTGQSQVVQFSKE